MPADSFLWIVGGTPPVEGETTDDAMKSNKAFELLSWSFGAHNMQTIGSGAHGAGAGKGTYNELVVTKNVERSSMTMFQHCLAGSHLPDAFLLERRAAGTDNKQIDWVKIEMKKVFISNISFSAGGGQLTESVAFGCGAMKIGYIPQKTDGSPDKPIEALWSKVTNKPELKAEA